METAAPWLRVRAGAWHLHPLGRSEGQQGGQAVITLHHAAQSRSFRVLWFLHEAGLPFQLERHRFGGKALRSPEFLALSPAGRVPALELEPGGRVMFESGAILQYLSEARAPQLGRAQGDDERAAYLEWMHYGETIAQHLAALTFQHVVLDAGARSKALMKLEALRLGRVLDGLVPAFTDGRDWLLKGGFSAADIMVGGSLEIARRFRRLDEWPLLAAYHARLVARPGFQAARDDDGEAELYLRDFYELPDD